MSEEKPIKYKIELSEEDRAARPVLVNRKTQRVIDELKASAGAGEGILSMVRSPKVWPQMDYVDEAASDAAFDADTVDDSALAYEVEDEDTDEDLSLPLEVARAESKRALGQQWLAARGPLVFVLVSVVVLLIWRWSVFSAREASSEAALVPVPVAEAESVAAPEPVPVAEAESVAAPESLPESVPTAAKSVSVSPKGVVQPQGKGKAIAAPTTFTNKNPDY